MGLTAKQQFAARLVEAMRHRGYVSKRGASSGVDVGPLAKVAVVTREMARRYTDGTALPDPNKMQLIAGWLNVRMPWLRDGEGERDAPRAATALHESAHPAYLTAAAEEIAMLWVQLPADRREWFREFLYQQTAMIKRYPWLVFGRPSSESYTDFERRAEQNYAAMVQLAADRKKP